MCSVSSEPRDCDERCPPCMLFPVKTDHDIIYTSPFWFIGSGENTVKLSALGRPIDSS